MEEEEMIKLFTKKRKGFTLIELIVVIAILGILAAIAVPKLGSFREGAEDKAKEADKKVIESAVAMYHVNHGVWPNDVSQLSEYLEDDVFKKYKQVRIENDGQVTITSKND